MHLWSPLRSSYPFSYRPIDPLRPHSWVATLSQYSIFFLYSPFYVTIECDHLRNTRVYARPHWERNRRCVVPRESRPNTVARTPPVTSHAPEYSLLVLIKLMKSLIIHDLNFKRRSMVDLFTARRIRGHTRIKKTSFSLTGHRVDIIKPIRNPKSRQSEALFITSFVHHDIYSFRPARLP